MNEDKKKSSMSIHRAAMPELLDDMEIPSLQYSLDELNDRISEGIEQYKRGECYSQEEAVSECKGKSRGRKFCFSSKK